MKVTKFLSTSIRKLTTKQVGIPRELSANIISKQQKEKDAFFEVYPRLLKTLSTFPEVQDLPEITQSIQKIMDYNLAGGKKNRGIATVFAYEMFEKPEKLTSDSMDRARIMGWCVEMLQAFLIISDDIMDGSSTRRGVSCWYRLPDVGIGAINDAILLNSSMFYLLKTCAGNMKQYPDIINLFHTTIFLTSVGQSLDYAMAHRMKNDYSLFTAERYDAIIKYKTTYYTFKLPVCLGLYLANNSNSEDHKRVEDICIDIGSLFQIQDDYIDCFEDEAITGKTGTDIQEGKCTWLAVQALQRCTDTQRTVFKTCYGSKQPAHIERIKQLYTQLQLPQLYQETEQAIYNKVIEKCQSLPPQLPTKVFVKLLDTIHQRKC